MNHWTLAEILGVAVGSGFVGAPRLIDPYQSSGKVGANHSLVEPPCANAASKTCADHILSIPKSPNTTVQRIFSLWCWYDFRVNMKHSHKHWH